MTTKTRAMKKAAFSLLGIAILGIGLAACSAHENPLKQQDSDQTVKLLEKASIVAEKKLHIYASDQGAAYRDCMTGKLKEKQCAALYAGMTRYLKTNPRYRSVTVDDVKSASLWKLIHEDYAAVLFGRI